MHFFKFEYYCVFVIPGSFCPQDLDATRKFYFPFHIPDDMSEDCLYLNIWTPPTADINSKLPVMVWFYGGAYVQGWCR